MDAARKFVDKGQLDKAIKEYLRVVKEDPQDVRVWLKVGDLYAKKGSKQEASETYLKVARFYQDQGFFLKAVAVYKQILKLDPRLVEVNLKLAELYRQLGLLSDAMQHFESVAAHFHREGKTKEALATVRQLVDLDPENIATRIKLAELYSKEAMNAEAVTEFQVACDQLRKQNRVDDFLKVAERLLWHKADNLPLNRELAVLYLRRNDPRRALQKLQACFKADPRDVETLALLAQAFQALDQKSKTVSVLKELARVFDENKQREKAEEVHRKILQFVPTDPDSLAYLGQKAKVADKFKPVPTPPPVQPPPDAAPRPARLNFTSEVAALQSQEPRMTGSMPLVEAQDFALPDYDGGDLEPEVDGDADFSADLGDDAFARGESSAGELHADEISKILTETDVYIKYGLHQKAIDHLRRVFALDADNLEARERLKEVLVSQGREREAVGELMKLAESVAAHDPDRAEGYLREVLSIDGAYRPALELARRFRLDLSGDPAEIDLDSAEIRAGAVAAVDDDLDFDGIDFGESSRRDVPLARADSFDGIDPEMFQPAAQGSPPGGVRGAAIPGVRPSPMADNTRQIAASEVEALAAMSSAPRSIEFEDGVVETPAPQLARPAWQQAHRSLDDVLDEQLDDSLGEDIDEDVARELSGAMPAPQFELPPDAGYEQLPPDSDVDVQALGAPIIPIGPMDELDDELPFDPAAARAFDAGLRPGSAPAGAAPQTGDVPPTFD
ncbi:MAG: tetratricopeptide repeat protein, partial [Kofleriaceae bacterium]|nr:tetratricopeptide repeat protein [Kofleriaceae bacterium]